MMKFRLQSAIGLLALVLAGCGSTTQTKAPEPPAEPVTGLHALAQMFSAARAWQPDIQVLRINSLSAGNLKPRPGRAAAWQGTFVSPTAAQSRTYTFSVVDVSTSIRSGIFPDPPTAFSARAQSAQPFNINGARKDTDEIYNTAMEHAGAYAKEHPDEPISYVLELNDRAPDAMWRVYWGTSMASSPLSVLVDAASGEFYRAIK